MRSGEPRSDVISFASGFPDAGVNWKLRDTNGVALSSGLITPAVGAVSTTITTPALINTLTAGAITGVRELSWNYLVGGVTVADFLRYDLEEFLPFGVSRDGVRRKLGIEELEDDQIDLAKAYLDFENKVTSAALTSFLTGTSYQTRVIADAIEATAALWLIPTMIVRVAKQESSGTNQFTRQDVEWGAVTTALQSLVAAGLGLAAPSLVAADSDLFVLVTLAQELFPG